ncbi:hypothetical protein EVAR_20384_1 [Eumeta japonica]|uniref:Uncharacterized protein n=1 Tax=Eumeta variegata TaxID=151549 RepID=A0A4C1TYB7_EUMVA|nr:hypothetical protein EVAR_20384_1 [Eumeta japonica]
MKRRRRCTKQASLSAVSCFYSSLGFSVGCCTRSEQPRKSRKKWIRVELCDGENRSDVSLLRILRSGWPRRYRAVSSANNTSWTPDHVRGMSSMYAEVQKRRAWSLEGNWGDNVSGFERGFMTDLLFDECNVLTVVWWCSMRTLDFYTDRNAFRFLSIINREGAIGFFQEWSGEIPFRLGNFPTNQPDLPVYRLSELQRKLGHPVITRPAGWTIPTRQ